MRISLSLRTRETQITHHKISSTGMVSSVNFGDQPEGQGQSSGKEGETLAASQWFVSWRQVPKFFGPLRRGWIFRYIEILKRTIGKMHKIPWCYILTYNFLGFIQNMCQCPQIAENCRVSFTSASLHLHALMMPGTHQSAHTCI